MPFSKLNELLGRGQRHRPRTKYVFILCPPYCGSTLLSQILASSPNVSINNSEGTCEGQTLPEVRDQMFVDNRWDPELKINWPSVKQVWQRHWDLRKPILLEKSPPNILRPGQIMEHFEPVYFFAMWRNPYAHCESQIRRNGNSPRQAAGFAIRCLKIQRRNIEQLGNLLPISYEELTAGPERFARQAIEFLPDLNKLKTTGCFKIHNKSGEDLAIQNLNEEKIDALSYPERQEINGVFRDNRDTLDYFEYRVVD